MSRLRRHPWWALAFALAFAVLIYFVVAQSGLLVEFVGRIPLSLAVLLTWVGIFPQEAKKVASEVIAALFYWSRRGQRLAVGAGLEADVARASRDQESETPGLFPRALRVRWHRGGNGQVDLPEGEVVVKLRDHRMRSENATAAVLGHVQHSALAEARPYLDPDLSRALEFAVANRMFEIVDTRAGAAFRAEVCLPACEGSPRLAALCDQTQTVDQSGLLTRIALREYVELGQRLRAHLPSAKAAEQSIEFLGYLHRIATKAPGEDLSGALQFHRESLTVGVVLVARPEIYALHGEEPYTLRVGQYAKDGVPVVYLIARGSNVLLAKTVASLLRDHGNVTSIDEADFLVPHRSWTLPAYLARVTLNLRLSRRAEHRFTVLRAAGSRTDDKAV
jgi:hypothetical protein